MAEKRCTRTGTTSPTATTSVALRGGADGFSGRNSRAQVMVENGTLPQTPGAISTRASRPVTPTTMPA